VGGAGRYTVVFARIAEQDLISFVDHIAMNDPVAAGKILEQIKARAQSLVRYPERGRVAPELEFAGLKTHREWVVARWRLVYRIMNRQVYIVAIFDGRRNLEDVLLDRVMRMTEI